MSNEALVTMLVAMLVIWGSLAASIAHALRTHRRRRGGPGPGRGEQ